MDIRGKITLSLLLSATLSTLNAADDNYYLNTVTVSAAGYEQDLVDAPASITVITAEDLKGKSYFDLTDALQDVPGVTIEGGGSRRGKGMGSHSISIRGMSSDYTLLLIDGKAQGNSGQVYYNGEGSGQEIGWLPPLSSIERIEIVRGPMSSLYGSQALGGVINIITKKVSNEWTGSLSIDRVIQDNKNSGDEHQYRYFLTGPIIKDVLGISLYGEYKKREEDKITNGYRENIRENNNIKLDWKINDKNDLTVEYGHLTQEANGTDDGIGTDTQKDVHKDVYGLSHTYNWTKNISTKSFIQHENMKNEFQNEGTEYISSLFNTKTVIPFETNNMTTGLEYKKEKTDHGTRGLNVKELDRWSGALFIEDEYFVSDDFSLTAGARWNNDEKYGGELTPRLYGVYKLNSNFTIKSGASAGYVTPNLKQGDSTWVEGGGGRNTDGADLGNDDLKPEKSLSYEVGLIYDNLDNFNLSLTAYKTDFKDKIQKPLICDRTSSGTDSQCIYLGYDYEKIYRYTNADEAELKGFEISTTYNPSSTVTLNTNYTYSTSKITKGEDEGDALNNYPEHMFNVGINWKPINPLKVWSKVKYKGRTLEDGENNVPAYTFVDVGLNYDISKNLSVYASIYNLFNKEITYEEYNKVLDGRKLAIGMTMKF